jgi:hypothetical protein
MIPLLLGLFSGRHRLQREQFLARAWSRRDALGDGAVGQYFKWAVLCLCRKPRVRPIALDEAMLLQQLLSF